MIRQTPVRFWVPFLVLLATTLSLNGCAGRATPTVGSGDQYGSNGVVGAVAPVATNPQSATAELQQVTQSEILQAQTDRAKKVELTVGAFVKKKLKDDTEGLPHERFLLGLENGTTVLVAHDTAMAPYVPLQAGDFVVIHGEYIWNRKGGVLHWTHHTDTPRHEGGWIDYKGQRYQ